MSEHQYIDNVLIKLKREYSKDELVAALVKQLSEKDVLIGLLKSEVDELQFELNKYKVNKTELDKINKAALLEARKDELYKNLLKMNNSQVKKVRELRRVRDDLIAKNYKLQTEIFKLS